LPLLKPGCQFVQVMLFDDAGTFHRDSEYWNMMAPLEQAALVTHEAIYSRARSNGVYISDESRTVVGMLFSGTDAFPMFEPIWNIRPRWVCVGGIQGSTEEIYEFYAISEMRNDVKGIGLFFSGFKGIYETSSTRSFIAGITLADFVKGEFTALSAKVSRPVTNETFELSLSPSIEEDSSSFLVRATKESLESIPPWSNISCSLN
jgi:hypothetical protein